jgi:hypothetical protein
MFSMRLAQVLEPDVVRLDVLFSAICGGVQAVRPRWKPSLHSHVRAKS